MLSPNMKGWGYYEYVRQLAQSLEQRDEPQPIQTVFAEGLRGMVDRAEQIQLNRGGSCAEVCARCPPAAPPRHKARTTEFPTGERKFPTLGPKVRISLHRRVCKPSVPLDTLASVRHTLA
jgi:hypothetical protein